MQNINNSEASSGAIGFLRDALKPIVLFVVLGLIFAIGYIYVIPSQYEVIAHIRLAQLNFSLPSAPMGTLVEDQNSLLARLKFPSNYSSSTVKACGYEGKAEPALALANDLKFSIIRGTVNNIELRLFSPSVEKATECAYALVAQIGIMQKDIINSYVEEAKSRLLIDNERLDSARRIIAKADQSGNAFSAVTLAARDEVTFFLVEREKKMALIRSAEQFDTKLSAPLYVSQKPVFPKKLIVLSLGLFGGIFFGIICASVRQLLFRLKK